MSCDVTNKTNTSIKFSLIFKGGQQVLALVSGIILARILSPEEFGVIAIVNMIVFYANSFTNFGLNNALIQKTDVEDIHINTVFTLDLIISIVLCLLTFLTSDYIGVFFNSQGVGEVLRWMSLFYIITTFYHIPIVILRKNIDFKFLSIVEFFEVIVTSVSTIILAYYGYSYWSIVIASLSVQSITTVVLMIKTNWLPRLVIGKKMGDIYSFGIWNFLRAQLELLVSKADYFFIGRYLGVYNLGLYEKSFEFSSRAMSGFSMPLNGVFFSTFSRVKNDVERVREIFLQASGLLGLLCYPVLFGLISVAPNFVLSCLGQQWQEIIVPLQVLAIASIFRILFGMIANVNVIMGAYRMHTICGAITSVIFIVLCFVFVSQGIVAVSFVYLFYCLSTFLIFFYIARKIIPVTFGSLIGAIWCPLIGSILMFIIVIFFRSLFFEDFGSVLNLIYLVFVGGTFYVTWCYYFYRAGFISAKIN